MKSAMLAGVIRALIGCLGGVLIHRGLASNVDVATFMSHSDAITGAAVVLAAAVWSALSKTEWWNHILQGLGMAPAKLGVWLASFLSVVLMSGCVATGGRFVKQGIAPMSTNVVQSATSTLSPKSDLLFLRFAFAYPFKLGNVSYEDKTGDSFSITGYETDGGEKIIAAASAAAVKALDAYLLSQSGAGLAGVLTQGAASKATAAAATAKAASACSDGACSIPVSP